MGLRPLACWDCGFESHLGQGCLSPVSVVCSQVEASVSGRSLVQGDPTECDMTECDCEASILRKPWPSTGFSVMEKNYTCLFTFRSFQSNVQCRPSVWPAHTNNCDMPSLKTYSLSDFCTSLNNRIFILLLTSLAGPCGRAVYGVGLRPIACWDCGFESHRGHGCLSVVSVVYCQVEVSATDWSLVQGSPTDCGASLCVINKPRKRGG